MSHIGFLQRFTSLTSCRRAGGRHDMPPPRPASGDTIYVMYAYGKVTITVAH